MITKRQLLTMAMLLLATVFFATRTPPPYSFSRTPLTIMSSYYDYMIGSYHNIPLQVLPNGGGYIMTYHGMITATAQRRVFYSCLDATGNVTLGGNLNEYGTNREGYPAVAVDPVSGSVLYAWHEAFESSEVLDVRFAADTFEDGLPGSLGAYQTVINNPISITSPEGYTTEDNQFIWPSLAIGPSPVPDKRRVYLLARNNVQNTSADCDNAYLAYADFNEADLQSGNPLSWSYCSIPRLNTWHHDPLISRSVKLTLACDQSGRVYLCGNHYAYYSDGNAHFPEPDIDIFYCDNYGAGIWHDQHFSSELPSWNPNSTATDTTGYFQTDEGLPYDDDALKWSISSTDHFNVSFDSEGRIHIPALWQFTDSGFLHHYDYRELNCIKEAIFDPATQQLTIKEVYPQKSPEDSFNSCYQPWDTEAPWGVVDSYTDTNEGPVPTIQKDWNYCLWDEEGPPTSNMMFVSNNIRITNANPQGMMAMVWQNSLRARYYHLYDDPDYAAYNLASEIFISVSLDNGNSWSEPIRLNQVETPEMAGILPLWTYAADKIIYTGESSGHATGKLGLMFYDDYDWIPVVLPPPIYLTNMGEAVMFSELQITFPMASNQDDPVQVPGYACISNVYPNSFSGCTAIDLNLSKSENIEIKVFNLRGQVVKKLFTGPADKGNSTLHWDGRDDNGDLVSSGVYFVRFSAPGKQESRKLVHLK